MVTNRFAIQSHSLKTIYGEPLAPKEIRVRPNPGVSVRISALWLWWDPAILILLHNPRAWSLTRQKGFSQG